MFKPLVAMFVAFLAMSPVNPTAFAAQAPAVIEYSPPEPPKSDKVKLVRLLLGGPSEEEKPDKPDVPDGEKYVAVIKLEELDEEAVDKVIRRIEWAKEDEASAIVIEINSRGGPVTYGFKVAKAIEESTVPVHCVVDDQGYSMGLYILQSCQTRSMTKRSTLMGHEPAYNPGESGRQNDWYNAFVELRALSRAMAEHVAARMTMSISDYATRVSNGKEYWLDWEEAWRVRAVDSVVKSVASVVEAYKHGEVPVNLAVPKK